MVNITNMQQLHSLIDRGIIKGCGHCNAEFDDDDFAFALETGICQCCHEVLLLMSRTPVTLVMG